MRFEFSERDQRRIDLFRKMRAECEASKGMKVLVARITTNAIFAPCVMKVQGGEKGGKLIQGDYLPPWGFMQYKRFFRSDP